MTVTSDRVARQPAALVGVGGQRTTHLGIPATGADHDGERVHLRHRPAADQGYQGAAPLGRRAEGGHKVAT